ncbi:hypothetical protein L798_15621 [Zootermopsis nevadensis]|uniref:Uncharacterized protein n=1 Tax=Zootermopsis nevadensis TaxID=136037 RepID=A0A067QL16_ZOONE|nr:hypothetical protein L798_15621 [Zootermopsis nevadensis]
MASSFEPVGESFSSAMRGRCCEVLSDATITLTFTDPKALRGWRRSGERARRSSGEPGSALLGLPNPFLLPEPGVDNDVPGLYDCVVLELPGW